MIEGGLRPTAKAASQPRHDDGTTDDEDDTNPSTRLLHPSTNHSPHSDLSKGHRNTRSRQATSYIIAIVVLSLTCICLLLLLLFPSFAQLILGLGSVADDSSDDAGGFRVLVLMGDNRELKEVSEVGELDEVTATAYLNYQYSRMHQPLVSFLYAHYQPLDAALQPSGGRSSNSSKHSAACYNAQLQQARAAPWCKIVAAYAALEQVQDVDAVLFIDSDAAITNQQLSVQALLRTVDTLPHYCSADAFLLSTSPCSVLFFKNAPFEPTWPNTGAWLVRRSPPALELLRAWWHFDHSSRNFYHAYEQDTLHMWVHHTDQQHAQGVLDARKLHFAGAPIDQVLGMVDEPSMQHVSALQFIHHFTSPDRSLRLPFFQKLIHRMQTDPSLDHLDRSLSRVIRTIRERFTLRLHLDQDRVPGIGGLKNGEGAPFSLEHWVEVWKGKLRPT